MINNSAGQQRLREVVTYEVYGRPNDGVSFGGDGILVPGQRLRARREQVARWVNPFNAHPLGTAGNTPPLVEIPDAEPDGEVDLDLNALHPPTE